MRYATLLMLTFMILLVGCSQTDAPAQNVVTNDNTNDNTLSTPPANDAAPTQTTKISQSELASHAVENDCWIAYNGNVYDVTDYVPIHPGGAAQIVPLCGTSDKFENAFSMQHGTSKVSILEKRGVYKGLLE